jgi:hypothetical protein
VNSLSCLVFCLYSCIFTQNLAKECHCVVFSVHPLNKYICYWALDLNFVKLSIHVICTISTDLFVFFQSMISLFTFQIFTIISYMGCNIFANMSFIYDINYTLSLTAVISNSYIDKHVWISLIDFGFPIWASSDT